MASTALRCAVALGLLLAAPFSSIAADTVTTVKLKLASVDARVEIESVATLTGKNLAGHLVGGGTDAVLTGSVKNRSVTVELTGRIAPACTSPGQSMSGTADNENEATSIELVLECQHSWLGETYHFRLYLGLPARTPLAPPGTEPGLSASLE